MGRDQALFNVLLRIGTRPFGAIRKKFLRTEGIRINAVAPGVVPTPLYGELSGEQLEALHHMQPLGRYGTPQDIADAVLYLVNASWVTGVILPVDGGVDAGRLGSR